MLAPVPVPYREPLFRMLSERGRIDARVMYLAAAQAGWDQRPDWFAGREGYRSEVLSSWQGERPGRSPVVVARGIGAMLTRLDPACVVSWEFGPATWRALAWCRRRRCPLVVFSELTPWSDAVLSAGRLRVHRTLAPRIEGFIVAGSQGVTRLAALGVERERVHVALQSADLAPLLAAPRRASAERGPLRILTVGRLVEDKNLALLLDAFAAAAFDEGQAELLICGRGPLEVELRARAARLGVPVSFLGAVSPSALPAVYGDAGAFALVSTYEPFGVAVREAAAAGLPLICTRRAGAAGDIAVEGESALLVDPVNEAEVTGALSRIVREPGLRDRLAAGSDAVTARHPLGADAQAWERAVAQAIDSNARR